ncbi:SDR family NAD(P)-dependent oxidoreductase [Streptomyces sp. NBC_01643]|uniref:SDR family NAD(P)-dependent oxidoreductase n=1 Tax=Streptomyces sp. NBC_01643 TaxID=2975906 RepID=UPI00386A579D|nr:SDR family NAD(P)-dependent oxidoreductase [Streptomyces sp. NBC_01643]WTD38839.1 SDR family NAD(P)-dependent oxidoreductase [Streptomyces sp. NBC_01643]
MWSSEKPPRLRGGGVTTTTYAPAALITGASSGIGCSYAEHLARRGYAPILVARRADRLAELAETIHRDTGLKATVLAADLAEEADLARVEKVVIDHDTLAVVVNAAGLGGLGPVLQSEPTTLNHVVAVNVLALTRLSRAALLSFSKRDSGTLINVSSIGAFKVPPNGAAYGASKAYDLVFSRGLQHEVEGSGIRVQVVLPGPVRTEFFDAAGMESSAFPQESFVDADDFVRAALVGLDLGELVSIPTLPDTAILQDVTSRQERLRDAAGLRGIIADRYTEPRSG